MYVAFIKSLPVLVELPQAKMSTMASPKYLRPPDLRQAGRLYRSCELNASSSGETANATANRREKRSFLVSAKY
jgi:hypothetical protein